MKCIRALIILSLFIFIQSCSKVSKLETNAISEASKGNYSKAIDLWNKILETEKDNPLYLNNLAWTLFMNDNIEKAKTTLEKAKQMNPKKFLIKSINKNLEMFNDFSKVMKLFNEKNYNEAITNFEELVLNYNIEDLGLKYLALCHEGIGKEEIAQEKWKKIVDKYKGTDIKNSFIALAKKKLKE